jgi:hypothetical protein
MPKWHYDEPNIHDVKRGVKPQAPGPLNAKKKLDRPWLIVRVGCKKGWLYEMVPGDASDGMETIWKAGVRHVRQRKHWFDPPVMEKDFPSHRTEEDARKHLMKNRWTRERAANYFIVHRDMYEQVYRDLWKE